VAEIALLTARAAAELTSLWPALDLLPHHVVVLPTEPATVVKLPAIDLIVLDARREVTAARQIARLLATTAPQTPLLLLVNEGVLSALTVDWGARDFILEQASLSEVEARIRLTVGAVAASEQATQDELISCGELTIDPVAYTARLRRRVLDLAYKEFELLRFLAANPGRVYTRDQLLQEVWGYDYYGGTRTVDVHIRRLRAKLGVEHEQMIGTVRNVGYRMNQP
jgi:DNA-binding response OmpR family regulator